MQHPLQPVVRAEDGVIRFQSNALVRQLLDSYPGDIDALRLACPTADQGDWEQLYQLIGWSVSGFGDLPNVSQETVEEADARASRLA